MARSRASFISQTALFLALAILLPVAFHALGIGGRLFLPMHFPAFLAGLVVGPASGLIVGLLAPGISHLLNGMPPAYAVWPMTFELIMYGLVAGLLYKKARWNMIVSLIVAMIVGRLAFGGAIWGLSRVMAMPYTAGGYFTGTAMVAGLPGIVLQLILIPILVIAIERRQSRPWKA